MTEEKKSTLTLPRLIGLLLLAGLAWGAQKLGLLEGGKGPENGTTVTDTRESEPNEPASQPPTSKPKPKAAETTRPSTSPKPKSTDGTKQLDDKGAAEILAASRAQRSGFMVTTGGRVKAVLADDNDGSRHQRFILRLSNGLTVLVAHNIDLAPRVPLDKGDEVRIHGQYEWNEQGGVLHWTHHAPRGDHEEGWIEYASKRYE